MPASLIILLVIGGIMWLALTGIVIRMARDFWLWHDHFNAIWGPFLWVALNLLIYAAYLHSVGK